MRVLGIDTATKHATIGLCDNGALICERTEKAVRNHASLILPLVEQVLAQAATRVKELDGIAVSAGPGSFTGLRIGLSIAKGLACATGASIVGVSTLEALARTIADRNGEIWAVLDARKGEVFAASFVSVSNTLRRLSPDVLTTIEDVPSLLPAHCTVIGDVDVRYGDFLRARLGEQVEILPFADFGPRGGAVAALGTEAFIAGRAADPVTLEPVYIRPSDAERLHG